MNLNERAAKCLGGYLQYPNWRIGGMIKYLTLDLPSGKCIQDWNPGGTDTTPGDYNHARLLYERVVEKNLYLAFLQTLKRNRGPRALTFFGGVSCALDLTAAQLTEACCEVLEKNDA